MLRRALAAVFSASVMSYAGTGAIAAETSSLPIPPEHQTAVFKAEKIGRIIYRYDRAAWVATDTLFSRHPNARSKLRGWIVDTMSFGWRVFFIGKGIDREYYSYRVELNQRFEPVSVYEYSTLEVLSLEHLSCFRARQLAIASTDLLCTSNYNPVVLPAEAIGSSGWLVYLLAASTVPGERYLGHHRILVNPTGTAIVKNEALSKSCVRSPPPPPNAMSAMLTHMISETPIDIHVYRNLVTDLTLYVGAGGNMWSITDGKIAFHGPLE